MSWQRIADDVKLGKDVIIRDFVNLYGCTIGDNCKIGTFVEIQKNASIGSNTKVSSHTFICEGVTIEDDVFIGHNVSFINDKYPRSTTDGWPLQTEADWQVVQTRIKKRRFDRHKLDNPLRCRRGRKCHCRSGKRRHA